MKKLVLTFSFLFFLQSSQVVLAQQSEPGHAASQTQWSEALKLLKTVPIPSDAKQKLFAAIDEQIDANAFDGAGLTIGMHAAALGNLEALIHIDSRNHDFLLQPHPRTGLTILHFTAQATGGKGAAVLNWFFKKYPAEALEMVNTRALNPQGRGNGHTVAMEAVFTKRVETVKALLDQAATGVKIDFTTTAVTGWGPKTIAEREKLAIAASLPPSQVAADQRAAWVVEQDKAYLASIRNAQEREAEETGIQFLKLISEGNITDALAMVQTSKVSLNGTYGRLLGTSLGTVTTPSSNRTPKDITDQTATLLKAGADPRVAEGSLMFVHGAFRSAVFGYPEALGLMIDHVESRHGKAEAVKFVNTPGPENGVTMGLDAAWRRRADVLNLWLDKGGDPTISSFAGETISQALADWQAESKANPAITPPSAELIARVK